MCGRVSSAILDVIGNRFPHPARGLERSSVSSPFVRRSTAVTAGAVVFAGLVAAPVAAFAAEPAAGLGGIPAGAVTVTADPDGAGHAVHPDRERHARSRPSPCRTTRRSTAPATRSPRSRTQTTRTSPVRSWPPRWATAAPAQLDVKNLDITTRGLRGRQQQRRSADRHLHVPRRRQPDQRLRGRHLPRQRRPGGQRDLDPQPRLGR